MLLNHNSVISLAVMQGSGTMQVYPMDLKKNYQSGGKELYVSFFSDCAFPVIGLIPKDKAFNRFVFLIDDEKGTFRYHIKKTGNSRNGDIYDSPEFKIPDVFLERGAEGISEEIKKNVEANFADFTKDYKSQDAI